MTKIIITTAALNLIANDPANNLERIQSAIDKAIEAGAGILVLPELTLPSYDASQSFNTDENSNMNTLHFLKRIADYAKNKNPNLLVSVGHIFQVDRLKQNLHSHDSAVICQSYLLNGQLVATQTKTDLANNYNHANTGPEYERRYFTAWPTHEFRYIRPSALGVYPLDQIALLGNFFPPMGLPIGDIEVALPVGDNQFALTKTVICEAAWTGFDANFNVNRITKRQSSLLGRDPKKPPLSLVVVPNGSPPATGKIERRLALSQAIARETNATVVYVNALGSPAANLCFEGDQIFTQGGASIVGERFSSQMVSHHSECVDISTITSDQLIHSPLTIVAQQTRSLTTPDQKVIALHQTRYTSPFDLPESKESSYATIFQHMRNKDKIYAHDQLIENAARHAEEMFLHDVLYFLDYMTKRKSEACFISLSGGYDSAYTLTVGCAAIELALQDYIAASDHYIGEGLKKLLTERFSYHTKLQTAIFNALRDYLNEPLATTESIYAQLNILFDTPNREKIMCCIVSAARQQLFHSAYIATNTSSFHTENAARQVAQYFNVPFRKFNIQSSVEESILEYILPEPITASDIDSMATYHCQHEINLNAALSAQLLRGKSGFISEIIHAEPSALSEKIMRLSKHLYKVCQYLYSYWKNILDNTPNDTLLINKLKQIKSLIINAQIDTDKQCYIQIDPANCPSWGSSPKMRLNLENAQARIRAATNWFINSMLPMQSAPTCNANQSEIVRGYTTYCGDEHAGTFSITSHRNKCDIIMIMNLLHLKGIQKHANYTLQPIDALKYIFAIPPSAELQPLKNGQIQQTDEDSFKMSYFGLRIIMEELLFVTQPDDPRLHQSPLQVLDKLMQASWAIEQWPNITERCNQLTSAIYSSYVSFYGAQFKVRALPVGPVYDNNVNQHVSLRTPNLSGQQRGECMMMIFESVMRHLVADDSLLFSTVSESNIKTHAAVTWLRQFIFFNTTLQTLIEKIYKNNAMDIVKMGSQLKNFIQLNLNRHQHNDSFEVIDAICRSFISLGKENKLALDYNSHDLKIFIDSTYHHYHSDDMRYSSVPTFFHVNQAADSQPPITEKKIKNKRLIRPDLQDPYVLSLKKLHI
ncbi:MAG: nitrilase-related carbon-nitrogen hydrolase [Gammaproteobacteria bacterium]|nr:nitrilase-related carbon-nitrogen hydrolase [Gammaproteobacteria bacterium]